MRILYVLFTQIDNSTLGVIFSANLWNFLREQS